MWIEFYLLLWWLFKKSYVRSWFALLPLFLISTWGVTNLQCADLKCLYTCYYSLKPLLETLIFFYRCLKLVIYVWVCKSPVSSYHSRDLVILSFSCSYRWPSMIHWWAVLYPQPENLTLLYVKWPWVLGAEIGGLLFLFS